MRAVLMPLLCVCSSAVGVVNQPAGSGVGDVHTYRDDGWVVKNAPARPDDDHIDLTAKGMERAAFLLLEMGQDAHAQRALEAGAR